VQTETIVFFLGNVIKIILSRLYFWF